jgi:hypothetical protein
MPDNASAVPQDVAQATPTPSPTIKPIDAEARARRAEREKLRRMKRRLDEQEKETKADAELRAKVFGPEGKPRVVEVKPEDVVKAEKRPTAQQIEELGLPAAKTLWATVGESLKGTPWEIGEKSHAMLVVGSAPYFAQRAEALSPKAMFIGAVVAVFVPPTIGMIMPTVGGWLKSWWTRRQEKKAPVDAEAAH